MAIVRLTAANVPAAMSWWSDHKAAATEYAADLSITPETLLAMINDAACIVLEDTVTQTLALGTMLRDTGHLMLMITRTTGVTASVRAVDRMFKVVAQGAINQGLTLLYGDYRFPAGVNVELTGAIRYFNSLTPPLVRPPDVLHADGSTTVRFDAHDIPALLAALTARTP